MESKIFQTFTAHQGYDNNRCSGYALAPILAEIYHSPFATLVSGEDVYDALCSVQQGLLSGYPEQNVSVQFVKSPFNIFNGTCTILPSSIVLYCAGLGLEVQAICSEQNLGTFGTEVFKDDCSRMKDYIRFVGGYNELESEVSRYQYLVALTRYKHWVSLKKTDGGYYLYDPAPSEFQGGMFGSEKLSDLLPMVKDQTGSKFFYGLVIGISVS
ncbi:MAG: hypothetical protein RRY42_07605 [Mucinivorans sp.]